MKVTMQKIAEIANVSRGTVDKVLNNRPGVSDAVRERVKKVAQSLNYKPNIIGKALAGHHSKKEIGVIVAPDYNPFVKDIKLGLETAREEIIDYGFNLDVRVLNTYEAKEQIDILNCFVEEGIDAIALFSIDSEEIREKINRIVAKGIPVVTYNSDIINSKRMCFVGQDHYKGGITASDLMTKILSDSGDVLIITSLVTLDCHRERIAGFQAGLDKYKSKIKIIDIRENQDKEGLAYEYTVDIVDKYPNIRGIYITGGGAMGVGKALKRLGKEKKIKVICHDLVDSTTKLVKEGIIDFTIGQDPFFQGYQAIKILFEYLIIGKAPEDEFVGTRLDIRSRSNIV